MFFQVALAQKIHHVIMLIYSVLLLYMYLKRIFGPSFSAALNPIHGYLPNCYHVFQPNFFRTWGFQEVQRCGFVVPHRPWWISVIACYMPPFFCYEKVHGSSNSFHSLGVLLILKKLANLLKARQKKKSPGILSVIKTKNSCQGVWVLQSISLLDLGKAGISLKTFFTQKYELHDWISCT